MVLPIRRRVQVQASTKYCECKVGQVTQFVEVSRANGRVTGPGESLGGGGAPPAPRAREGLGVVHCG